MIINIVLTAILASIETNNSQRVEEFTEGIIEKMYIANEMK
jgi:hypothetical protein